jgi:hypothetical protein
LNEIKVLSPSPFTFKVTKNSSGNNYNVTYGDLYFNDTLVAKAAILNKNHKFIEMVMWIKDYEKIKDRLPAHNPGATYKGTQYIVINDISNISIVDDIKEIKVMAPSPFRFEVENKNWGKLYFNNL